MGHIFPRGRQRLLNGNLRHRLSGTTYSFRQHRELLLVPGLCVDTCSPCPGERPQACLPSYMTAHLQDRPVEKKALDIPTHNRHISPGLKQAGTGLDAMKKIINYINGPWSRAAQTLVCIGKGSSQNHYLSLV